MDKHNLIGLYKALARIICRLPFVEQKEFVKQFRFHLAHEAKKKYPENSNCDLAQITGISRGAIQEYLDKKQPDTFVNKDSVVLSQLWIHRDENNKVPMHGENSFYSIAKSVLGGSYKPQSTLAALIQTDSIEIVEDGVLLKNNILESNQSDKMFPLFASRTFERYVNTLLYNFNPENIDKLFDQTYFSTQTKPENFPLVINELKEIVNKQFYPIIQEVMDKYESDVPVNTYPEISFHMSQSMNYFKI